MTSQTPSALTPASRVVPTRDGYDLWSEIYDTEDNPLIRLENLHIARLVDCLHDCLVLDLGCGTGRHTLALAQQGSQVIGMDFSDGMMARAREKTENLKQAPVFLQGDLHQRLPFRDRTFAGVGCFLVIEHIRDTVSFLRDIRRVLRPGGHVVMSTMHPAMFLKQTQAGFSDPRTGDKIHPRSYPYTIADLFSACQKAGLTLQTLIEEPVTPELVAVSPRAAKYLDWPLLLALRWLSPKD